MDIDLSVAFEPCVVLDCGQLAHLSKSLHGSSERVDQYFM
jgi:hypothetical protein